MIDIYQFFSDGKLWGCSHAWGKVTSWLQGWDPQLNSTFPPPKTPASHWDGFAGHGVPPSRGTLHVGEPKAVFGVEPN